MAQAQQNRPGRRIPARALTALVVASLTPALPAGADSPDPGGPVVEITQGRLAGAREDGLAVFRNIPFAAAPVGKLRWRAPRPAPGWDGVRDATRFGAVCPQALQPGYSREVLEAYPMSEDCLQLNVWTPAADPAARRPVMVWILPGGFTVGAPQMPRYSGAGLAGQGNVVVTFNYRLGFLGQFAHPALAAAQKGEPLANYNLMDQVAALEWVRDNIADFGGDPDNVTIFGMSAGGVSVNYLMTIPAARGLFHRAISQSSGIRVSAPRHITREVAGLPPLETTGKQMAAALAPGADDPVAALRAVPWRAVLAFQSGNPAAAGSMNPVVDGRFVTTSVGEVFRAGRQAPVSYVAGATDWEGSLVQMLDDAEFMLRNFRMTRADAKALYGDLDGRSLIDALEADFFFGSQHYLAKLHAAAGHPSWLYLFTRVLDAEVGRLPGAAHGAETRYAMLTLESLEGPAKMPMLGNRVSDSDRAYAELVSAYWSGFAATGDPNGPGRPRWPRFDAAGGAWTLEFAQDGAVARRALRAARMRFFEEHFEAGRL